MMTHSLQRPKFEMPPPHDHEASNGLLSNGRGTPRYPHTAKIRRLPEAQNLRNDLAHGRAGLGPSGGGDVTVY